MTTDGLNVHRLTSNDVIDFYPSWSPDSQHIAFMSGFSNIFVMNRDGSDAQFLTNGEMPVWSADGQHLDFVYGAYGYGGLQEVASPDGQRLAYSVRAETEQFRHDLYVKNMDGTQVTRLFTSTQSIWGIDW